MSLPDFNQRSAESELMDNEPVSFAEFYACLRQLRIINFFTLAYTPTLRWFGHLYKQGQLEDGSTVLDVGSGYGDMLRCLSNWAAARRLRLHLIGVDLNPLSKLSAERATSQSHGIDFITDNVFSFAPEQKIDYIISSLFTHHLTDQQLVEFIRWMDHRACLGWLINDLHRHPIPYYFIKSIVRLLSRNRLIRHDAPVSVARAFTVPDLKRLLETAGIPAHRVSIRWCFPFRYAVTCSRT
ncbi:MAG TPA: methyltransferase domain-containing protein [Methylobacter sp.]|jgi:SAM-dependent methyltransferase